MRKINKFWLFTLTCLTLMVVGCGKQQAEPSKTSSHAAPAKSVSAPQSSAKPPTSASSSAKPVSKVTPVERQSQQVKQLMAKSDFAQLPGYWSLSYRGINPVTQQINLSNLPKGQKAQFGASTIKVFILAALLDQESKGHIKLTQTYQLQASDKVGGTGILQGAASGSSYSYKELANLMITQSDNTATNIIIQRLGDGNFAAGFSVVNNYVQSLGYRHTKLQRKMMDLTNQKNNMVAANEACDFLYKLYQGQLPGVDEQARQWFLQLMTQTTNRQKFAAQGNNGITSYNKSGESSYQGIQNDLAIVTRGKQAYVVAGLSQLYMPAAHNPGQYLSSGLMASSAQTQQQVSAFSQLGQTLSQFAFKQR
ncbi:hypothetical protein EQG49_04055 [Periweissella cryptocerci]|uniref:Beta-lactamase class A catalytic domain-containing protein n=1 Tax=Periweissella cryptocerci TaxID=2506420 RepID=A0A4P6YSP5_9LACO|nr:serine hydrolase [Periweissella cryptocerci]QBO35691.1 hypothetical protein EQG49_04055 [Periweissella cryptocerci]